MLHIVLQPEAGIFCFWYILYFGTYCTLVHIVLQPEAGIVTLLNGSWWSEECKCTVHVTHNSADIHSSIDLFMTCGLHSEHSQ